MKKNFFRKVSWTPLSFEFFGPDVILTWGGGLALTSGGNLIWQRPGDACYFWCGNRYEVWS